MAMSKSRPRRDIGQILKGRDRRAGLPECQLGTAQNVEQHGIPRPLWDNLLDRIKSFLEPALGELVQGQCGSCEGIVRARLYALDQISFGLVQTPSPGFEQGEIAIRLAAIRIVLENIKVELPRLVDLAIGKREHRQIAVGVDVGPQKFGAPSAGLPALLRDRPWRNRPRPSCRGRPGCSARSSPLARRPPKPCRIPACENRPETKMFAGPRPLDQS